MERKQWYKSHVNRLRARDFLVTGLEREGVYSEKERKRRQEGRKRRRERGGEEEITIRMLVGMGSQGGGENKASPCASM